MKRNSKKGSATPYLIIILLLVIAVAFMFIRLNWQRFKVEAHFGFTVAVVVIAILLILFLLIRHSIRKSKKKKEKEKARLEKERLEQQRIAEGGRPSTLGNGKAELSDVSEVAGKAIEKVDEFLMKGDE